MTCVSLVLRAVIRTAPAAFLSCPTIFGYIYRFYICCWVNKERKKKEQSCSSLCSSYLTSWADLTERHSHLCARTEQSGILPKSTAQRAQNGAAARVWSFNSNIPLATCTRLDHLLNRPTYLSADLGFYRDSSSSPSSIFSPATLGAHWTELDQNRPHARKWVRFENACPTSELYLP